MLSLLLAISIVLDPWKSGNYTVGVRTALSDSAASMLDRPFEVDSFEKTRQRKARMTRAFFKIEQYPSELESVLAPGASTEPSFSLDLRIASSEFHTLST